MKFLVVCTVLFVAVNCLPQGFYPRYRNAFRLKRQDDQISDKVNTLNDPELYPQVPTDQLGPHLEEPVQETDIVPDKPSNLDTKKQPETSDDSVEDEEKDDENIFNFFMLQKSNRNRQVPISFFPIMFAGSSARNAGNPYGGVAIANSFSTGRKGVANSNALAGADPSLFRRGTFNQDN